MPKGPVQMELERAQKQLLEHGWIQGTSYVNVGRNKREYAYCAYGAVWHDPPKGKHTIPFLLNNKSIAICFELLHEVVEANTNGEYTFIVSWNDAPGRTLEEVIYLFDDAIELARQEGI